MTLTLFRAKLHGVTVTQAELYYEGSITIDSALLEAAGLLPYEKVQVVNVNNGSRLETYIIPAPPGTGTICLNGPAARLASEGDKAIIIAYADMTPEEAVKHVARVVLVDENNRPVDVRELAVADPALPAELIYS